MQEITNYYATIDKDSGGKVQRKSYDSQFEMENNKIIEIPINTTTNEEKIKIINMKNSTKHQDFARIQVDLERRIRACKTKN